MTRTSTVSRVEQIARLNDRCRWGEDRTARTVITATCIAALAPDDTQLQRVWARANLMKALRNATFTKDTPERDFGEIEIEGTTVWFKIDYYDPDIKYGSDDPADASKTVRVLTIMLPEDY